MVERQIRTPWRALAVLGFVVLAAATTFANDEAVHQRMKKDIFFLASEECEGRGIDTQGINLAANYIAGELKKAGLKPGGKDRTYFQPFPVRENMGHVEGINTLALHGPLGQVIELKINRDFKVLPLSVTGKVSAPVVFAGYGVEAKAADYDDYKDLDVAGKIVVVLRRVPRWDNEFAPFGGNQDTYAGWMEKVATAERKKAAAVILVNDRSEAADGDKFMTRFDPRAAGAPVVQMRRDVLDMMLVSGKGTSLLDLEKDLDRDLKPRSGPIAGWTATLQTTVTRPVYECKNIIGVLEGSGPLANETVVIGAHYDHWGYGGWGSLAADKSKKQIHPGADDNGSGTTTVLELARRFAAMKDRKGRRLVFMFYSGEERGLFGSKFYCNKEPLFPLESTVAMVNLDMVGRLKDEPKLRVEGVGTGKGLEELVDALNADFKFVLQKKKGGTGPSDHDSFCRKNVPVLFLWTGLHEDYHRPTDTADRINIPGMIKIAALSEKLIAHLSTTPQRPEYIHVKETPMAGGGTGPRMRIGMDYGDDSNKGILIETVVKDGPADKGGMKPGDRIIAINNQSTLNFTEYLAVMRQQKAGVPLQVTVNRMGMEIKLTVTPE
jgi:hypothetical protein